jgi:hypothetical protein
MLGPLAELVPEVAAPLAGCSLAQWRELAAEVPPSPIPASTSIRRSAYQPTLRPPSTARTWPVTKGASAAHRACDVGRLAAR